MFGQLLLFGGVMLAITAALDIVGSMAYEAQQIKQRRSLARHPFARKHRRRPLISVVVFAENDEAALSDCLDSLLRSSYRKLEIIVADNASTDETRRIARQYIADHRKVSIRLYGKRRQSDDLSTLAYSYKKYIRGELVLLLKATETVTKRALSQAATYFNTDESLDILSFNSKVATKYSTVGLFQKFEELLRYRSKKFNSVFNTEYSASGTGAMYKFDVLGQLLGSRPKQLASDLQTGLSLLRPGNRLVRSRYASDVVMFHRPFVSFRGLLRARYRMQSNRWRLIAANPAVMFRRSQNYTRLLSWLSLPFTLAIGLAGLVLPVLVTYFLYLALDLHQPDLLLAACAALSIFIVAALWGDEDLPLSQKLTYSALIPITYAMFYILSFVQLFVVLIGSAKLRLRHAAA